MYDLITRLQWRHIGKLIEASAYLALIFFFGCACFLAGIAWIGE